LDDLLAPIVEMSRTGLVDLEALVMEKPAVQLPLVVIVQLHTHDRCVSSSAVLYMLIQMLFFQDDNTGPPFTTDTWEGMPNWRDLWSQNRTQEKGWRHGANNGAAFIKYTTSFYTPPRFSSSLWKPLPF
jgi:hypothetical protein